MRDDSVEAAWLQHLEHCVVRGARRAGGIERAAIEQQQVVPIVAALGIEGVAEIGLAAVLEEIGVVDQDGDGQTFRPSLHGGQSRAVFRRSLRRKCCGCRHGVLRTSALLPSPNRIRKTADNRSCVNYINLHTETIPIPKGKHAQVCGAAVMGIGLSLAPPSGPGSSPLGAGRVSVVDLGEVGRARKLALRRRRSRVVARRGGEGLRWEFRGGPESCVWRLAL
jgi:hypothetical protein